MGRDPVDPVDADWPLAVAFLKELVRAPSDSPPGDCAAHAERTANLLEQLGFSVERHMVPEPFVKTHGMRSVTNLVVRERFGAGAGPVIALAAHGDTVPPGDGWTVDPYGAEEHGGAIYGRGAAVSKSDFATYAFALRALKAQPAGLAGTVELHFTYDEATGGFVGPQWLLEQEITRPTLAISAGFTYAVVVAHNGCLHLEVVVRGRQAHAAMPQTGVDALEAATSVLAALYRERRRLCGSVSSQPGIGSPTLTIGLISGGISTNVVPDRVVMRLDRRLIPEEEVETVEAGLKALVAEAGRAHPGIEVECRRVMLAEPLRPVAGTDALAEVVARHAATVLGTPVETRGAPLYTDARHYAAHGIPTVLYGAGPRSIAEANAHGADEHVRLSDLMAAIRIVAASLRELLGG